MNARTLYHKEREREIERDFDKVQYTYERRETEVGGTREGRSVMNNVIQVRMREMLSIDRWLSAGLAMSSK
jgi:hypothetical protein